MILSGIISKIVNYQREYGTGQLIRACLITLKNTIFYYNKEIVGCITIGDRVEYALPKIPVVVRPAELSDVPELKTLSKKYKKRDFLKWINDKYIFHVAQLKHGGEACTTVNGEGSSDSSRLKNSSGSVQAAGNDKKIIGYVCVCPAKKSNHKLVSLLKLKETDYWAVDAYIYPAYRGKGINSAIASEFLAQAKREGYRRGYGTISFNNYASRRAYEMIGEKEIGVFTTITLAGLTFHFLKRNRGHEEYFN